MISKVTESNKELIKARIAEINEALAANGSSTVIDSFESYYANIVEIAALATNFHNAPYKYFLMPLDEPLFEIDANKRTISVPAHFSKNGVGVYGDHMAEVLYFAVDRYFDYQDLFSVDEIVINWQFRPSNASRNAAVETKTSIALAPDDTFEPGKIVFGWVITNEMTPSKGTLTFSVSFLKRTGDVYEYVLNTQMTSVVINDSLVLEDPSALDSMARPVFERLMNSRYTIDNVTPLVDPSFRTAPILDDHDAVIGFGGLDPVANFGIENGIEDSELVLQAIGYSADDGNIKYTWHGTTFAAADDTPEDDDNISVDRGPNTPTVAADYVVTADTVANDHITYFVKIGQDMVALPCDYDDDEEIESVQDALDDLTIDVYELGSSLEVGKAGQYGVTMQGVKEISQYELAEGVTAANFGEDVYYVANGSSYEVASAFSDSAVYYTKKTVVMKSGNVMSQTCIVPVAAVPSVTLTVEGVSPAEGNYSIVDEDVAGQYVFVEGSAPSVNAVIGIDESKIYDSAAGTGVRGVTAGSSIGAVALVLSDAEADAPDADDFAGMTFAPCAAGDSLEVTSAGANVEGTYLVYAINRRNHTYSVSDPSNELKVSYIAPSLEGINVSVRYAEEDTLLVENNAATNAIIQMVGAKGYVCDFTVSVSDTIAEGANLVLEAIEVLTDASGNITRYLDGSDDDAPNVYPIVNGVFQTESDPGHFIIRATTQYNGTQRVTETAPFVITSDI